MWILIDRFENTIKRIYLNTYNKLYNSVNNLFNLQISAQAIGL